MRLTGVSDEDYVEMTNPAAFERDIPPRDTLIARLWNRFGAMLNRHYVKRATHSYCGCGVSDEQY